MTPLPEPLSQVYDYDPLNRLLTASEGSNWSQTYDYCSNPFGNRAVAPGSTILSVGLTPQICTAFDPATNRLTNSAYDNAGNLTTDATSRTMTYDGENRQTSFTTPGQPIVYYSYDGEGRRVKKTEGGLLGSLLQSTQPRDHRRPAERSADHLGMVAPT